MSFFGSPNDGVVIGSIGPRIGFFEGLVEGAKSVFDQQFHVDSQYALQQEMLNRWEENLELLEKNGDTRFTRLAPDYMDAFIRSKQGREIPFIQKRDFNPEMAVQFEYTAEEGLKLLEQQEAAFIAAGLPGFDQIFEEVVALQKKVEERTAYVAETGGAGVFLGGLAGGIAGSFTTRDPINIATLPLGGFGRTAGLRVLTEAGVAGAVEAGVQYGYVAPNRELAGLPQQDILQNVLYAAGGAAALRGVFEGGAAGLRSFRQRTDVDINLNFEDAQLRQMLGELPDSPRVRAATDLLDDDAAMQAASPYGTSYQALRRFTDEVAEAELALLGHSDTAIRRVVPDMPRELVEEQVDFNIVREQKPEVAARFDAAEARLADLDGQLEEVATEIQSRTVVDAVRLVDEEAADELVRLAESPLPEPAKQLEADIIFNRVGKDRILRAAEDAEIAPRKQTQRLRQQRKLANKEYRAALNAMRAEREKLVAAADRVKALAKNEAKDLLGYTIQTRPIRGSALASEAVVAQRTAILKDAEKVGDDVVAEVLDDGTINFGGDNNIPADFKIFDPDTGAVIEVGALMKDLDEQARLVEAMRSCSL